jgi:thiamine biosynthesis protein ThiS
MTDSVHIKLNGEPREVPKGTTVTALLSLLGIAPGRVAVEINTRIVGRAEHQTIQLGPGDEIEVVTFVGGGAP